jgi:manganese efflux pump family protein
MGNVLALLLFVLPLSVDTFAIAAAVGADRLSGWRRWRTSMIFAIFEGGTPLIGLGLGSSIGQAVGGIAEYLSGALLILLGSYLWWSNADPDDDDDEATKTRRLINARGFALIGLALSISLDELAIGFSFGLGINITTPVFFIAIIAIQALVVSQLGLLLGAWISERLREDIECLVGPILIVLGCYSLAEALIRVEVAPTHGTTIVSTLVIVLATAIIYRCFAVRAIPVSLSGKQLPAFDTYPGELDQSAPLHPKSWRYRITTASCPPSGQHRAHHGVSSRGFSTSDYGPPRHVSEEAARLGYHMDNRRES